MPADEPHPYLPLRFRRLLRSRKKLTGEAVQVAIVVGDLLAIVAASVLSGVAYHQAVYDSVGEVLTFLRAGAVIATVVVIFNLFRGEYQLSNFLSFTRMCAARSNFGT